MSIFNKIIVVANLTRGVEMRYIPSGDAVATLGLAINSGYGDKKEVCFIDATVWKKQAENCNEYLSKGSKVLIEGSLKQDTWEQDGQKRSKIKINAFNVQFLDGKKEAVEDESTVPF